MNEMNTCQVLLACMFNSFQRYVEFQLEQKSLMFQIQDACRPTMFTGNPKQGWKCYSSTRLQAIQKIWQLLLTPCHKEVCYNKNIIVKTNFMD